MRLIESLTSYFVAGFMYSPAFRSRRWDGREHLLRFSMTHGYRAPIGLLLDVAAALRGQGLDFDVDVSKRLLPDHRIEYDWNNEITLRKYQREAIAAITKPGITRGSGIVKMPIRSGKTKTAAGIIRALGVRAFFFVPSQMLLYQTRAALEEALMTDIGMIGDSEWNERDVTVATIQTITKARGGKRKDKLGKTKKLPRDPRYKDLIRRYPLVLFDECHHLRGDAWHDTMMDFDSAYRIGLSATAFLDNVRENERGAIWLKACCGRIRIDIPTSRLIDEGYLMKQNVELHVVREPDLHAHGWSQALHNAAVYENDTRNEMIASLAKEKVDEGLFTLIVSNRLNQISRLADALEQRGVSYHVITGDDKIHTREMRVEEFKTGDVKVLLGTVFGEGIDIPEVECVINAEGGRDIKATVQRMRNLTPHKGKDHAVFIDFMDMTNKYFAQHSKDRLETYRSEPAFDVKIVQR